MKNDSGFIKHMKVHGSLFLVFIIILCAFSIQSCRKETDNNEKMIHLLDEANKIFMDKDNPYYADAAIENYEAKLRTVLSSAERFQTEYQRGEALLKTGDEMQSIIALKNLVDQVDNPFVIPQLKDLMRTYALANLRLGERQNCINNHSSESCILPIRGNGIHKIETGSREAIRIFTKILIANPLDYESQWLLNIAYMTLGEYPAEVPAKWLIPDIDKDRSNLSIKPFVDVAPELGLNIRNNAGGVIMEDMNNDGYLDVILSDWRLDKPMHYFQNDQKGGFVDISVKSGLARLHGGLNLLLADYNNDGNPDIFVLRGAWCGRYGRQPNSLLRNNGDDTFTDVTIESGLFSKHPTQTGQWRDFNNDGWLDLFIGNESSIANEPEPCELYISNRDGTFTEVAAKAGCQVIEFIKSVAAGDYNNDGLTDLFLSSTFGRRILLKNTGIVDNIPQFVEATQEAGLKDINVRTFITWFWDYNNDGWLDIFVCGYEFGESIAHTACTELLGIPNKSSIMYLYKNNKDGTFINVSKEAGLNTAVYAMGSNFGDIDNDGYLDMYLGTGNPLYSSLVPNRLFKNMGNEKFVDITIPARVGNLQKGHGVAIADIDNDGDQDIFIEMGGAFPGDTYNNSLYMNPGQSNNNWINIRLVGNETNRSAIGTRIKVSFKEHGKERTVYRDLNYGGSFGSSTLRREIGVGEAEMIDEIEITWQKTRKVQAFKNIKPNQFLTIKEGDNEFKIVGLKNINFIGDSSKVIMCKPSGL